MLKKKKKTSELFAGELKDPQTIRRGSGLYHPPAPADVEKMRKNKILEEKAFAFLREFFSQWQCFMLCERV